MTRRFMVRPQQKTKPPTVHRATLKRGSGKSRRYSSKMDSLTAVIAGLYSSSVAITHWHRMSADVQLYMILNTYFSECLGVLEKDRMFSASVMDA